MHNILLIFSLIISVFSINKNDYVDIEKINCNYEFNKNINLDFRFNTDNYKEHFLDVNIDLFNSDNKIIKSFKNQLKVKGIINKSANIDYLIKDKNYLLVSVNYNDEKIISNIRFDLITNNSCNLNKNEFDCNFISKSIYKDGRVEKEYSNFKILNGQFDTFLVNNRLNLSEFKIYSLSDLKKFDSYLIVNNKIDEFKLDYNEGYKFILNCSEKSNNIYTFSLLDNYYLDLIPFELKENYSKNDLIINDVYFPFFKDYKEYNCSLILKGNLTIRIDFNVGCSDKLFGDCSDSKYCLEVINYV